MFVAMLVATGAGLAPPYLAGHAIDDGIVAGDIGALNLIVVAFVGVAILYAARDLRADLPGRLGRHARPAGPARARLRPPAVDVDRLLHPAQPGRADQPHDQRHRGAQPARHQRRRDDVLQHPDPGRRRRHHARCSTSSWRWSPSSPSRWSRSPASSSGSSPTAPTGRRASGSRRSPPTCRRRLSGVRVVRSFGQEPRHAAAMTELNEANREANMRTVYLNASYFPAVELLSAVGTAAILLYGGTPGDRRRDPDRRDRRLRRLPADLLRPDPAALPALHDLPAGDGGARQDLRPARHRARHGRRARRDRPRRRCAARSRWRASGSPTRATRRSGRAAERSCGRCATSTCTCRPGRRWPWSARPGPASRPSRSWSRASTTRSGAGARSTGTTCAACGSGRCARQLGIVPQEGFLFSGSVRENIAFGRPEASLRGDRGRGGGGRRDRVHRGAAGRDRDRGRRARRAALRRPAPARRLRPRPARRAAHPDPRRGDLERRRAHREDDRARASSGCSPGARRSSSPTASRRSAAPARSSSSRAAGSPRRAPTTS